MFLTLAASKRSLASFAFASARALLISACDGPLVTPVFTGAATAFTAGTGDFEVAGEGEEDERNEKNPPPEDACVFEGKGEGTETRG